jgi:hypothetical protein
MDKSELKRILKPLIKSCIKEVMLEEDVISTMISEVIRGTSTNLVATPQKEPNKEVRLNAQKAKKQKLQETRKMMSDALGNDAYAGIFENLDPLTTTEATSTPSASTAANPLSGYAPTDAGIDIRGLVSIAGDKWSKLRG